jgi:hypothetical protein
MLANKIECTEFLGTNIQRAIYKLKGEKVQDYRFTEIVQHGCFVSPFRQHLVILVVQCQCGGHLEIQILKIFALV